MNNKNSTSLTLNVVHLIKKLVVFNCFDFKTLGVQVKKLPSQNNSAKNRLMQGFGAIKRLFVKSSNDLARNHTDLFKIFKQLLTILFQEGQQKS
jgi:hypothetical protein